MIVPASIASTLNDGLTIRFQGVTAHAAVQHLALGLTEDGAEYTMRAEGPCEAFLDLKVEGVDPEELEAHKATLKYYAGENNRNLPH